MGYFSKYSLILILIVAQSILVNAQKKNRPLKPNINLQDSVQAFCNSLEKSGVNQYIVYEKGCRGCLISYKFDYKTSRPNYIFCKKGKTWQVKKFDIYSEYNTVSISEFLLYEFFMEYQNEMKNEQLFTRKSDHFKIDSLSRDTIRTLKLFAQHSPYERLTFVNALDSLEIYYQPDFGDYGKSTKKFELLKKFDFLMSELEVKEVFKSKGFQYYQRTDILDYNQVCNNELSKGHIYWQLNKYEKAIEHYYNFIELCERTVEVHLNIGDCYFKLDQGDSAYHHFLKAYELDPENALTNFNLGVISYTSSINKDAKKYFKKAIMYSDTLDFHSYDMLIEIYNDHEEFDSSFVLADELIGRTTNVQQKSRALLTKAFIYGDMGKEKVCANEINKVLEKYKLNEDNLYNAIYNRYLCYYMINDRERACEDYNFLKEQKPFALLDNYFNCK